MSGIRPKEVSARKSMIRARRKLLHGADGKTNSKRAVIGKALATDETFFEALSKEDRRKGPKRISLAERALGYKPVAKKTEPIELHHVDIVLPHHDILINEHVGRNRTRSDITAKVSITSDKSRREALRSKIFNLLSPSVERKAGINRIPSVERDSEDIIKKRLFKSKNDAEAEAHIDQIIHKLDCAASKLSPKSTIEVSVVDVDGEGNSKYDKRQKEKKKERTKHRSTSRRSTSSFIPREMPQEMESEKQCADTLEEHVAVLDANAACLNEGHIHVSPEVVQSKLREYDLQIKREEEEIAAARRCCKHARKHTNELNSAPEREYDPNAVQSVPQIFEKATGKWSKNYHGCMSYYEPQPGPSKIEEKSFLIDKDHNVLPLKTYSPGDVSYSFIEEKDSPCPNPPKPVEGDKNIILRTPPRKSKREQADVDALKEKKCLTESTLIPKENKVVDKTTTKSKRGDDDKVKHISKGEAEKSRIHKKKVEPSKPCEASETKGHSRKESKSCIKKQVPEKPKTKKRKLWVTTKEGKRRPMTAEELAEEDAKAAKTYQRRLRKSKLREMKFSEHSRHIIGKQREIRSRITKLFVAMKDNKFFVLAVRHKGKNWLLDRQDAIKRKAATPALVAEKPKEPHVLIDETIRHAMIRQAGVDDTNCLIDITQLLLPVKPVEPIESTCGSISYEEAVSFVKAPIVPDTSSANMIQVQPRAQDLDEDVLPAFDYFQAIGTTTPHWFPGIITALPADNGKLRKLKTLDLPQFKVVSGCRRDREREKIKCKEEIYFIPPERADLI